LYFKPMSCHFSLHHIVCFVFWRAHIITSDKWGHCCRYRMVVGFIYYLCNQCLSPLKLWVRIPLRRSVLNTALCVKVCQRLVTGLWISAGTPVSSTNNTDHHDINRILLKVALSTITLTPLFLLTFLLLLCSLSSSFPFTVSPVLNKINAIFS
jgi:hypothetical protein